MKSPIIFFDYIHFYEKYVHKKHEGESRQELRETGRLSIKQ